MPIPLLPSLQINGYRGLRHLDIDHLGRVNLIVGKNNSGKSTLLEALRLYTSRFSPIVVRDILLSRDEVVGDPALNTVTNLRAPFSFESLFTGRHNTSADLMRSSITIGTPASGVLMVQLAYYGDSTDEQGNRTLHVLPPGPVSAPGPSRVGFFVTLDAETVRFLPLDDNSWYSPTSLSLTQRLGPFDSIPQIATVDVPASGLNDDRLGLLYDGALLDGGDKDALSALRIIAPDVERVFLVGAQAADATGLLGQGVPDGNRRVALVQTRTSSRPVPLRSMGDGMNRLFGTALALVNARDGVLCIDEFENGVHYSVQEEIWRTILDLADQLNVQVFATSHSWDCVVAFQQAATANTRVEGVLVRLERRTGDVIAVPIVEETLEAATRRQVEVR